MIYVSNGIGCSVSVINGSTNQVVSTVNVGLGPTALSVNPTTNVIYVANEASNTISVINANLSISSR
jgi:YVTN family beta-propeller protein